MYWHSRDNQQHGSLTPGLLIDRSFWLHDAPRLTLRCRLLGHKPVVDGYEPHPRGLPARAWVTCDRCGVRPDPQGDLDTREWPIGSRYDGPHETPQRHILRDETLRTGVGHRLPGPWPANPTGHLGAQLLLGRTFGVFSIAFEVGCAGGDNTLAAHIRLNPLGALYVHTEGFGTWLQRRWNRKGFTPRVISLSISEWAIHWQLWARQGEWSRDDPWWMHGRISFDLVEKLLGSKRYSSRTMEGPVMRWLHMPEGDSHQVQLTLKRVRLGRSRAEWAARYHWSVEWESATPIVIRPGRGGITAASVRVPDEAVESRSWDVLACMLAEQDLSERRAAYGYRPEVA